MNRDRLASINRVALTEHGYKLVHVLQDWEPEMQVAAPALVVLLMADVLGIPVPELLGVVDRATRDADGHRDHRVSAFRDYIQQEVK